MDADVYFALAESLDELGQLRERSIAVSAILPEADLVKVHVGKSPLVTIGDVYAGFHTTYDIVPIVDVERGGERNPNQRATAQQVIDCTSAWVNKVKETTGPPVCLYGRGAMRDLSITSKMGCETKVGFLTRTSQGG